MYLIGHIPVTRSSSSSRGGVLEACRENIENGIPVFFFPEGTRSKNGKLGN